jgi:antitoxin (DNA-binding transcriptional repressor) of toxin-antitoxin stability system
MAMSISVTEARAVLADLVGRVLDGEEITLTRHGEPVAMLVRPRPAWAHRAPDIYEGAEKLREELEAARHRPISDRGLRKGEADKRVRELRAERDGRR